MLRSIIPLPISKENQGQAVATNLWSQLYKVSCASGCLHGKKSCKLIFRPRSQHAKDVFPVEPWPCGPNLWALFRPALKCRSPTSLTFHSVLRNGSSACFSCFPLDEEEGQSHHLPCTPSSGCRKLVSYQITCGFYWLRAQIHGYRCL